MSKSKTVYKPWGKEVWLELNDHPMTSLDNNMIVVPGWVQLSTWPSKASIGFQVVDKTKHEHDSKRVIEVRANLLPVLNFIMDKLKDKNWKEISGRKPKWDYPRLELDEFKKMLEGKV